MLLFLFCVFVAGLTQANYKLKFMIPLSQPGFIISQPTSVCLSHPSLWERCWELNLELG